MKTGIICIEIGLFSGLSWIEPVRGPTWSISILLDQQGDDHKLPPQSGRWCLSLVASDPSAALECVVTSSHLARITFLWSCRCLKCNSFSQFHDQLIPLPWQEVNCLRDRDSPVSLGYLVVSFWSYIIAGQTDRQTQNDVLHAGVFLQLLGRPVDLPLWAQSSVPPLIWLSHHTQLQVLHLLWSLGLRHWDLSSSFQLPPLLSLVHGWATCSLHKGFLALIIYGKLSLASVFLKEKVKYLSHRS